MSPTVFRHKGYRFYFFSREEARMNVHVSASKGEGKFWSEPDIGLAMNAGCWQQTELSAFVAHELSGQPARGEGQAAIPFLCGLSDPSAL